MRILLLLFAMATLYSCNVFNLEKMGETGQPCFNNGNCNKPLVCVEKVCVESTEDSDISNLSDESNESDDSDLLDELEDSDTEPQTGCNFGELCWKVVPTQQTRCVNDTGFITCPESNNPFYGQNGNYAPTEGRDFENINFSGEYFVLDNKTGLFWQKTSSESGMSFDDAELSCQALNNSNAGGKNNWRLPYLHELVSIYNFDGVDQPMTDGFFFSDIKAEKYWTLTKLGYESYYFVDFSGENQFYTDDHDTGSNFVICVSSNLNYDTERAFNRWKETTINSNIIVEDRQTGLVWQKVSDFTERLWKNALVYCESLSYAGKTDWRLPNVNELHSLATYDNLPELQTTFPGLEDDFFWTSTTNANNINNAWVVEFKYGILKPELLKSENINGIYTMCVRANN